MSAPAAPAASGIHAHPNKKTGLRPNQPRDLLSFGEFLTAVPDHPLSDAPPPLTWPMDKNDVAGDCVVAGLDHSLQCIDSLLGVPRTNWTDGELLAYYQTQNPGFRSWSDAGGPNDEGMEIQAFLEYLVKKGIILGFAGVDTTNDEEIQAAIYLGLAVVTGEDLQVAQQTQIVWDYVKGSPAWGGHCTCWVGYSGGATGRSESVTWGEVVPMTDAFKDKQVSEAYFLLTAAQVARPGFRDNYNLDGYAAAYTAMTGRPFPVVAPPAPPPAPVPTPTPPAPPTGAVTYTVADETVNARVAHAAKTHRGGAISTDEWLTVHLQSYFR